MFCAMVKCIVSICNVAIVAARVAREVGGVYGRR
jgi:hypothetical protein